MESNVKEVKSLLRTARIIVVAIWLQATVFTFWGLNFFLTGSSAPSPVWPTAVFSLMAIASFLYGLRFFQNYTALKRQNFLAMEYKKRRESLLVVVVIQSLLLEFVCILGITLSIFLQKSTSAYPFYALFVVGLGLAWPKEPWFTPYFQGDPG